VIRAKIHIDAGQPDKVEVPRDAIVEPTVNEKQL